MSKSYTFLWSAGRWLFNPLVGCHRSTSQLVDRAEFLSLSLVLELQFCPRRQYSSCTPIHLSRQHPCPLTHIFTSHAPLSPTFAGRAVCSHARAVAVETARNSGLRHHRVLSCELSDSNVRLKIESGITARSLILCALIMTWRCKVSRHHLHALWRPHELLGLHYGKYTSQFLGSSVYLLATFVLCDSFYYYCR